MYLQIHPLDEQPLPTLGRVRNHVVAVAVAQTGAERRKRYGARARVADKQGVLANCVDGRAQPAERSCRRVDVRCKQVRARLARRR